MLEMGEVVQEEAEGSEREEISVTKAVLCEDRILTTAIVHHTTRSHQIRFQGPFEGKVMGTKGHSEMVGMG